MTKQEIIKQCIFIFLRLIVFLVILFGYFKFFIQKDLVFAINSSENKKKNNLYINKTYIYITAILSIFLCVFNSWLCFPGYADADTIGCLDGRIDGWRPINIRIIAMLFRLIFGLNMYPLFLFNVFFYYLSLFILSNTLYMASKNSATVLIYLSPLFGCTFFNNMLVHDSTIMPTFVLFVYSISIFIYYNITKLSKKYVYDCLILYFLFYCFSLNLRHNAIIYMFPSCMIVIHSLFRKFNYKQIFKYFIVYGIFSLIFTVGEVKVFRFLESYPANHVFLHQIVGTSVISNDYSYIDKDWYMKNKTLDDAVDYYKKHNTFADGLGAPWVGNRVFKFEKLNNLTNNWIKIIFKHPVSYINYLSKFFIANINSDATFVYNFDSEHVCIPLENFIAASNNRYSSFARYININEKKSVYDFMYNIMIKYVTVLEFIVSILIIVFYIINIFNKKFSIGIYISFGYIFSLIIISIFSPTVGTRYMVANHAFSLLLLSDFVFNNIILKKHG